jgi:hypothetical protein
MIDYQLSEHARTMLGERRIDEHWVKLTIEQPDRRETQGDGTVHCIRAIEEFDRRHLRVVVNIDVSPQKVVTAFFDRRLRSTA